MNNLNPDAKVRAEELIRKAEADNWCMMHVSEVGMFFVRGDRRPVLKDMLWLVFATYCWASSFERFFSAQSFDGLRFAVMLFSTMVFVYLMIHSVRRYSKPVSVESRFISSAELVNENCPAVL